MRTLLLILFAAMIQTSIVAQPLGLIPYRKGNAWGYANAEGKIIIQPVYERTFFFSMDSLARVKQNGRYGFIDGKGNVRIKPTFVNATDFMMGVANVEADKKKYCIDVDGNVSECNPVDEEFTPEQTDYTGFQIAEDSGKYALIVDANKDTIDDRFDEIKIIGRYFFPRVMHFAIVRKKDLYGVYSQIGMAVAPVEFSRVEILDMDYYKGVKNNKWGVNDFAGKAILPFTYDSIVRVSEFLFLASHDLKNNHFIVEKKKKFGVMDADNQTVIKPEYDVILNPKVCTCPTEYVVGKEGKFGLTDYSGKLVIPLKYKEILPFQSGNVTWVKTLDEKEGYISNTGMEYFTN